MNHRSSARINVNALRLRSEHAVGDVSVFRPAKLQEDQGLIDARVVKPIPLLDEAALAAVHEWSFKPTIVNGQAVPVRMNVTVNFTLR